MPPLLLFTVDVEEDMPGWEVTDPVTVSNALGLPRVAELCARLGVRPTWLCTYPMATEAESANVLGELHARGDCEIGTHLHPWNTPPFGPVPGRAGDERRHAYYPFELEPERLRAKLETLHGALTDLTGAAPRSYRAGRFGVNDATIHELVRLGYAADSSITPLADHRADQGPDFRRAPRFPYRPARADFRTPGDLPIVEIPVSIGLTRRLPGFVQQAYVHLPRVTRIRGLLSRDHLNWVDYGWLYPVRFDLDTMVRTARVLVREGSPVLNVFVHSSEFVPGMSGRVRTPVDVEGCLERLEGLFRVCLDELGAVPRTLAEAAGDLGEALDRRARA
jgi:hypothetical protein